MRWCGINESSRYYPMGLPENIHLMDLRYAYSDKNVGKNKGLIFEIWNMFELNENKQYSVNKTISINDLFNFIQITNVTEMTLNGIIPLQDLNRLKWKVQTNKDGDVVVMDKDNYTKKQILKKEADSLQINMIPRDIRTFVVNQNIQKS